MLNQSRLKAGTRGISSLFRFLVAPPRRKGTPWCGSLWTKRPIFTGNTPAAR